MAKKIILTENEVVTRLVKWIREEADVDELGITCEKVFGGKFEYIIDDDTFELIPDENYQGAFYGIGEVEEG